MHVQVQIVLFGHIAFFVDMAQVRGQGGFGFMRHVELGDGRSMDFRITIASAPKVGSGPRPKSEEMLLMRRVSEDHVLTISAELGRHAAGGIKVGSGGPLTTGGN